MKQFWWMLFSYKGRANRKSYALYHICALVGYYFLVHIYVILRGFHPGSISELPEFELFLLGCLGMLLIYCTIPVSIKRYHDFNKSCWSFWLWSWGIPVIINICIIATFLFTNPIDRLLWFSFFFLLNILLFIGSFIYLCCKSGTKGENKFGIPPV